MKQKPKKTIFHRMVDIFRERYLHIVPDIVKGKCTNPDAYLDEQDLIDIFEAEEDLRQGRIFTTKELRIKLGIE
jgi:hypothetical protein